MQANTSLRIIVVDDNHDNADSQTTLLKMAGHEVHVAYGGEEALRLSAAILPHVMLIDLAMPQMSGDRLAQEIRHREECKDTLLIAVTGYADEAHRQTSRHAGFNHYLVKPIDQLV